MMASASSTATSATTATAATSHRSRQSGGPSSRVKHPRKIGMPQEYSCEELEVLECETTHIHRADLGLDDLVASAQHPDTVARSGVVADATERLAASITKGTGAGDGATGSAAEASSAASHGAFGSSFVAGRRGISQYLHRGALTSAVVSGGRGCSQYLDGGAIARAIAGAVAVGDYDFDEEKDDDGEPLVQVVDNGPNMLARNLVHAPTQKEEMDGFIFRPVPEGSYTRCHFVLQDGQYNLLIEQANKTRSCILAAKRDHKVAHIEFLICKTPGPVLKHSALYLGKLRCSLTGNEFTLYNDGLNPNKMKRAKGNVIKLREELLAVHVGKPTGSDGPLKLSVIIPQLDPMDDRVNIVPIDHRETLLRRFKSKDSSGKVVVLQNKPAEWSTEKKGYVLNFNGRVSMSSVKNFQLVHPNNSEYIVLQFGRTSSVQFALDFSYPLCPYQAFALALCGYTKKFGK
ncbi:tubby protein homolog [Sycon ciliatum]|uniref:tubby protein homolog n=1 Tax=Sycon ciliatum TaxID=27933 RepID=UPI0031F676D2